MTTVGVILVPCRVQKKRLVRGENKFEPRPKIKRDSGAFWGSLQNFCRPHLVSFVWKSPLSHWENGRKQNNFYLQDLQTCLIIGTRRKQTKAKYCQVSEVAR